MKLNHAKVLADLRTAHSRLRLLEEQNRFVPLMDKPLPWIEGLLKEVQTGSK